MGRKYSVSNAFGTTYFYYDALGRIAEQKNPDSTYEYWCYDDYQDPVVQQPNCHAHLGSMTGSWIDFQDENGNQWQRTSDGLGRLIEVMEPSGSSQTASMETDYGYDPLDDLTSVKQWGGPYNSSNPRIRSFTYDGLSRLTSATNPESGTISYQYDGNSNVISKTAPLPNQTGSATVVTNYAYDALNRLISKSYSNAPAGSMTSCYVFDTNGAGRLAFEWTQTGSCPSTPPSAPPASAQSQRIFGAYDAVGRPLIEQQCSAGYCTSASMPSQPGLNCTALSSATGLQYCYDLPGNLLAFSNGVTTQTASYPQQATLFSQSFDGDNRLTTVNSSWHDQTHPSPLLSNASYAPNNALSTWLLGTSLWTARNYDSRARVCNQQSATQQISPSACP